MQNPAKQFEEYCTEHNLKNEYWCQDDESLICQLELPKHSGHNVMNLSEIPPELVSYNYRTIVNPEPPKEPIPPPQPQPPPQIFPQPVPINSKYLNVHQNDLNQIKDSYAKLKLDVNSMINSELSKIQNAINGSPVSPDYRLKPSSINYPKYPNNTVVDVPIYQLEPRLRITMNDESYRLNEYSKVSDTLQKLLNLRQSPRNINGINETSRNYNIANQLLSNPRSEFPYIFSKFDNDPYTLMVYEIETNRISKLKTVNFFFPRDSAMTVCRGDLFVCGGKNNDNSQMSMACFLSIKLLYPSPVSQMNVVKRSHTITNIKELYIYSIGGYNSYSHYLDIVEKYLINEDKWIMGPNLNKGRQDVSVCNFNETTLYAFGGSMYINNNWIYDNNIERLNTLNESAGWENIQLNQNLGWYARVFMGTIQISKNQIMVFGGYDSSHIQDVLIFNTVDKTFIDSGIKLIKPNSFIQRNADILSTLDFIYAIGFPQGDVHRYDFTQDEWAILTESF